MLTDDVREAIRHVGGLMFDRRRAGWQVVVVTDDTAHSQALAILGARIQPLDQAGVPSSAGPEIRTEVSPIGGRAAHGGGGRRREPPAQRLLWGRQSDHGSTSDRHRVRHDLSPAARTFKAQALYATGLAASVDECEHFWADGSLGAFGCWDLVPDEADLHLAGSGPRVGP
ncbi:hypothetical protein AU196_00700 [Mycobacterium sp. IS-1742]|nr:hypothetical protein AU196_00700 [Mycobacterium sp. IS-1742]